MQDDEGIMDTGGAAPVPPARSGGRERSATFSAWLDLQEGRTDPVGWLARAFGRAGREGQRNRLSGVAGITRWWRENAAKVSLPPDELEQAIGQARKEFLEWQAALSLPPPSEPRQEPPPVADAPPAYVPPAQTGEILSVVYGQLSRIEGYLGQGELGQALARVEAMAAQALAHLAQLGAQATELAGAMAQVLAWQQAQDERLAPLMALIEDLQAADDAAGQALADGDDPAMPDPDQPGVGSMPDMPDSSPTPPYAQPWANPQHDVAGDVREAGRQPPPWPDAGAQQPGTRSGRALWDAAAWARETGRYDGLYGGREVRRDEDTR